ncbi:hypothetical protein [Streptomyces sp. NBC_00470]|uniref:hypothetical protein n=1 Tax=Streptomyces sp. NBC_00470 TaxID=2975753 RepID=UPI002F913270
MTHPFSLLQVGVLAPGAGIPVTTLVQAAVEGTVDDSTTEHAEALFAILDERGAAAWEECALVLTEFTLTSGRHGHGAQAAERYLAQQPAPSPELPVLTAMHGLNATFIRHTDTAKNGHSAARGFLAVQPDWIVQAVARHQFCEAAVCGGYLPEWMYELCDALCVDEHGQRLH